VFSQFASTLRWLKEELPRHGFQYRTLSGDMSMKKRAKALSDFQNDPPSTIFLLSMRAGAVGINLTQANRVFIMEPCFNPAIEAQAIGRVHRLGQKRNVVITRLIMKDSVESRMVEMLENRYGKTDDDDDDEGNSDDATEDDDGNSDDDADDATEDDDGGGKKMAAAEMTVREVMVGCLKTDKAQIMAEEFDLLYGLETGEAEGCYNPGGVQDGSCNNPDNADEEDWETSDLADNGELEAADDDTGNKQVETADSAHGEESETGGSVQDEECETLNSAEDENSEVADISDDKRRETKDTTNDDQLDTMDRCANDEVPDSAASIVDEESETADNARTQQLLEAMDNAENGHLKTQEEEGGGLEEDVFAIGSATSEEEDDDDDDGLDWI
jgi:superfamily II DNA or RNA helicase